MSEAPEARPQATWRREGDNRTAASDASSDPQATGMSRRVKLTLAVGAVVLGLWALLYFTVGGDFYQTVEEVRQAAPADNVRVGGMVTAGSLQQQGDTVTFTIEGDSGELLDVRYVGTYPERLGPYERVVAEGSVTDSDTFEATELLVKCPDKLLPEKITNGVVGGVGLERILY